MKTAKRRKFFTRKYKNKQHGMIKRNNNARPFEYDLFQAIDCFFFGDN